MVDDNSNSKFSKRSEDASPSGASIPLDQWQRSEVMSCSKAGCGADAAEPCVETEAHRARSPNNEHRRGDQHCWIQIPCC
ncbi:hypothetical protein COCON_G00013510 [Conger conger]|uniref:Uncharacterized protein n=1 Tax=Conger conger TaxID=82655 RepID=A0A9Q1E309_CONCO|nr:hypothetical protein COCON_G00013510 [Conger conger]